MMANLESTKETQCYYCSFDEYLTIFFEHNDLYFTDWMNECAARVLEILKDMNEPFMTSDNKSIVIYDRGLVFANPEYASEDTESIHFFGEEEKSLPTFSECQDYYNQLRVLGRRSKFKNAYNSFPDFCAVINDIETSPFPVGNEVCFTKFQNFPCFPSDEYEVKCIPVFHLENSGSIEDYIRKYAGKEWEQYFSANPNVVGIRLFAYMWKIGIIEFKEETGVFEYDKNNARRIFVNMLKAVTEKADSDESGDIKKEDLDAVNLSESIEEIIENMKDKDIVDIKTQLLQCDKRRADIDPFDEKLLTDPNRGHWELWKELDNPEGADTFALDIGETLFARNPICDVNDDGVIAIDFGTKSTIVVYMKDVDHPLPMGVGLGKLKEEPTITKYENPTVMHFVDLEKFLKAYGSGKGRPQTNWEDLTVSHTAVSQFDNSKSDEYYHFLRKLKQWTIERDKQFRIQSAKSEVSQVLKPFLELGEDDLNPIEIYAYYLGLYINNMRNGIYLNYYLSFPVSYEKSVRDKIVNCFEKGLKRSLPNEVLHDDEIMKRFTVNGEISEPAAYAVCALLEYGIEPCDDEEIVYGVFDFGGGTTDFDFGIWKESSKKRYDYSIESFGGSGDEYLGGENLLEMLAFDVFKENQQIMRESGFTFSMAPKCTEFLGSESLISESQEAEKNMHSLAEKLRPYWESGVLCEESEPEGLDETEENFDEKGKDDSSDASDDTIELSVYLFDSDGKDVPGVKLKYSKSRMKEYVESIIREGVNNFLYAFFQAHQHYNVKEKLKAEKLYIFLAGNSCKSPLVKKIFIEEIEKMEERILNGKEKPKKNLFELFPPLGTEEAFELMKQRGIDIDKNDLTIPTGKTGVAFGLIQCRKGGVIERIINSDVDEEVPFAQYIGYKKKKKFIPFFDEDGTALKKMGKPNYNKWYRFIDATENTFEIFSTTLPECINGDLQIDGNAAVRVHRCQIDVTDEKAYVYIRAIDPHTLQYAVSTSENVEKDKLGEIFSEGGF